MGYFAGLGVSLEETAICIVDKTGKIVREARTASEPEALVAFFGACGMEMERIGLEACSLTAWLRAGLTEDGLPAICIEARGIAQIMRTGWYRAVHVKSFSCRSWRALLTARRLVPNKRRDVENGVRALLREAGLKVGTPSRKGFATRVRELAADDSVLAGLSESLLSVVEVMNQEVESLTKRVLDEVKVEPTCRRLMTVPGVGPLTALAFRATIDQPGRFRKSRDVGAHLGLTPSLLRSVCEAAGGGAAGGAPPVRRNRRAGPNQPVRRRAGPNGTLRGGAFPADPQQQVVGASGVGDGHRQAPGHGVRPGRGGAQALGDPAPHVGRRQRVPLGQAGGLHDEGSSSFRLRRADAASFPWGRWARRPR